jgi:hypothetical protein
MCCVGNDIYIYFVGSTVADVCVAEVAIYWEGSEMSYVKQDLLA